MGEKPAEMGASFHIPNYYRSSDSEYLSHDSEYNKQIIKERRRRWPIDSEKANIRVKKRPHRESNQPSDRSLFEVLLESGEKCADNRYLVSFSFLQKHKVHRAQGGADRKHRQRAENKKKVDDYDISYPAEHTSQRTVITQKAHIPYPVESARIPFLSESLQNYNYYRARFFDCQGNPPYHKRKDYAMNYFDIRKTANPSYYAENVLPARSDHARYASAEEAIQGRSSLVICLDGIWKFKYAANPTTVPADFLSPNQDINSCRYCAPLCCNRGNCRLPE